MKRSVIMDLLIIPVLIFSLLFSTGSKPEFMLSEDPETESEITAFWPIPSEHTTFSAIADKLIGTPAVSGRGRTPSEGFSSGGLVQYLYKEHSGILLSRKPSLQRELGKPVSEFQEGDLLFFNGDRGLISGVYLHDQEFITVTNEGVSLRNLRKDKYWRERFLEGRRLTDQESERLNPSFYSDIDHQAVREALSLLHRPYRLTGSKLSAFDCSFLVQHAFAEMNIYLPRMTYQQYERGEPVSLEEAEAGDVIYFSGTWQKGISHTGIYLGDRFFIHASGEEGETIISYLGRSWMDHFTGIRRFDSLAADTDIPQVREALPLIGTDYKKGGRSPKKGFSRSGFIHYVFKKSGISLPRSAKNQAEKGISVSLESAKTGDVLFFRTDSGTLIPALYIGNEAAIAVRMDEGVSAVDLQYSSFWNKNRLADIRRYN
ncbi:C40 family peptidase [Alteribacter lacisalsi]|uniref:C40 family peptidase n=1 Tax=Alteribacter lacisalsi TaxID=2045244 RepID=UPI001374D772|nr:NlpC/P60 family protein [Alteribacter lacisalsi]